MKKKVTRNVGILIIILIILFFLFYFITNIITKYTGFFIIDFDKNFETCLKEKTIILYINSNAPEKTLSNLEIKDYLENIKIFNCLRNNEYCYNKNINYFPTWFIEGKKIEGDVSLEFLADVTECE